MPYPFAVAADDGKSQIPLRHRLVRPAGHVCVPVEHAFAQVAAGHAADKVQMGELATSQRRLLSGLKMGRGRLEMGHRSCGWQWRGGRQREGEVRSEIQKV